MTKKSIRPRFRHLQAIQARQRQDKESKFFNRKISTVGLKVKLILESEIRNKELNITRPNTSSDRSSYVSYCLPESLYSKPCDVTLETRINLPKQPKVMNKHME